MEVLGRARGLVMHVFLIAFEYAFLSTDVKFIHKVIRFEKKKKMLTHW